MGLNYMVLVNRHVGRHLRESTYLFSSEVVATRGYRFWKARTGIVTLALVEVKEEWGYASDDGPIYT